MPKISSRNYLSGPITGLSLAAQCDWDKEKILESAHLWRSVMEGDTLLHSEHYRGFQVEVMQTPNSDLWEFGHYYCVYDEDGTERLDGNEQGYEPKDFQYRDPNDALRSALWMIDRYWLQGERWHISDEERLSLNLR